MLDVHDLRARGRHAPLLRPTTFSVGRGELLLLESPSQLTRTGLGLLLTGRMAPDGGTVRWGRHSARKDLRRISQPLDSPTVNAMEPHQRVRDHVREMLAYQPRRGFHRRPSAAAWLAENDLEDLDNLWDEQLDGHQRLRLITALARQDPAVELLVLDTPSRHLAGTTDWIPYLQELAEDPDHPRAVVATVPHLPEDWDGPGVVAGNAEPEHPEEEDAAEDGASEGAAEHPEDDAGEDGAVDEARPDTSAQDVQTPDNEADPEDGEEVLTGLHLR